MPGARAHSSKRRRPVLLGGRAENRDRRPRTPYRRLWIATSRAARGTGSTERTPRSPDGMSRQHPEDTSLPGPVEISLISAVRTHALCVHTQDRLGGRHRRASRRGTAAHLAHLAARTLRTHAYAGLIRPREKAPTNPDLRRHPERETAGHSVVHTQESATNHTN